MNNELVDESMFIDEQDETFERFNELCADLNLDAVTRDNTWRTFATVRQKYTLEGDAGHWLCCAVYVACRQATIPSVGLGGSPTVHGSYVNLTRLLRTSKLSLVDFFDKSRKWGDMTNMSQDFRSKIERLERNFAVTTVIFKKFEPIFAGLFKDFSRTDMDEYRANRKKLTPKSAADLFEFCWTLFLCVKSSLRISDDLVNSYHLLLACADLVFHNVVQACRTNLLTPKFSELAEAGGDPRSGDPTCIIHALCDLYDGVSVEAKTIKEFWLKSKIRTMIDAGLIRGDPEALSGLIDEDVFENNYRKLEKEYEEYVLTEGDFDERMYLSPEKQADFGMDSPNLDYLKSSLECQSPFRTVPPLHELRHLMPQTPLTGKKYLSEKEEYLQSPISQATQTVSRLQALLSGRKAEPSSTLRELLSSCKEDPFPSMKVRLQKLSDMFIDQYANRKGDPNNQQPGFHQEFALYRSQLSQTLYYRLLESILSQEAKLKTDKAELTEILMDDAFNSSLFACAMEIVLFSFNSNRRFPWILEIFNLPGYHFFKLIEIVVRTEESLSRDVVKHLSQVEEKVLEELAWNKDSPLWVTLADKGEPIPSCEEVFLPSQMERGANEQAENAPKRYAVIKTPQGEKCVPVAVGGTNQSTLIIQDKTSSQILGVVLPSKHGDKPKKGSSVALFFRKFYHLSFVRLQDLCKNLTIEEETLRKIWTCFQQSVVNNLEELMKSRHLDQIIMCIVYVVSKVVGSERTFTEIMRCYRLQPQSASHVYRSVLLANPGEENESRGDLIRFYNTNFIGTIQKYALKFSPTKADETSVPLSPVPHLKAAPYMSPCRKVATKHSVFLRPLRAPKTPSPAKPIRYNFGNRTSPNSNSLRAINTMIQISGNELKSKAVKRLIAENEDGTVAEPAPAKQFVRKLQDFMDDRQGGQIVVNEGMMME